MLDLRERGRDDDCFVRALEGWVIDAVADLGVEGAIRPGPGRRGSSDPIRPREDKIAAWA